MEFQKFKISLYHACKDFRFFFLLNLIMKVTGVQFSGKNEINTQVHAMLFLLKIYPKLKLLVRALWEASIQSAPEHSVIFFQ
jgi:hypothetical protein